MSNNGYVNTNAGLRVSGNGGGRGGKMDSPNSDDAGYGTSCGSRLSSGSKQQEREGDLADVFVRISFPILSTFFTLKTCCVLSETSWLERCQRPRRQQGPHRSRVHLAATPVPGPRPLEHHPVILRWPRPRPSRRRRRRRRRRTGP